MKYPKLLYDMADGPHDWYTPRYIIDALGQFDTDPCSPLVRPFDTARIHYTRQDNGLCQPWVGRVWLNPPYDTKLPWMKAMARHGNGIALVYNRLGRQWFDTWVMPYASGLHFSRTIKFLHQMERPKEAPHNPVSSLPTTPWTLEMSPCKTGRHLNQVVCLEPSWTDLATGSKLGRKESSDPNPVPTWRNWHDSQQEPSQVNSI